MIHLKKITQENLEDVLRLKVKETQEGFVSSVAESLAQAYVYRNTAWPFAVCESNEVVGFIMLGFYQRKNYFTLWKLLIDERHQGRGYGRKALQLGVEFLRKQLGAEEIYTGVSLGNSVAEGLYLSVGFVPTGVVEDGMKELVLR